MFVSVFQCGYCYGVHKIFDTAFQLRPQAGIGNLQRRSDSRARNRLLEPFLVLSCPITEVKDFMVFGLVGKIFCSNGSMEPILLASVIPERALSIYIGFEN
jgi:hypothetical protein